MLCGGWPSRPVAAHFFISFSRWCLRLTAQWARNYLNTSICTPIVPDSARKTLNILNATKALISELLDLQRRQNLELVAR